MRILWIIDNKLRELWGVKEIKQTLKKSQIELILCNKLNWNLAINYFSPDMIILPNIRVGSIFKDTVEIATKKKIKCILYRSEGLNHLESDMSKELPSEMMDKITKMFLWSDLEGQFPVKNGYKDKVTIIGALRFVTNKKKNTDTIKTIGIPTTGRYAMNFLDNNIARYIYTRTLKGKDFSIGIIKNEIDFLICVSEILKFLKNDNLKFIIKPHPFENFELYKRAFHNIDKNINIEIEEDPDIRVFLNKTDVLINQYSSANVHALKAGVPVLNITKLIPWDYRLKKNFEKDYIPSDLGILVKDKEEIRKYLTNYSAKKMLEEIENKGDFKLIEQLSPDLDSVKLFSDEIIKLSKDVEKKKRHIFYNFINCIKYYLKEIYIILFKKRSTLYHEIKSSDRDLIEKFSLSKN